MSNERDALVARLTAFVNHFKFADDAMRGEAMSLLTELKRIAALAAPQQEPIMSERETLVKRLVNAVCTELMADHIYANSVGIERVINSVLSAPQPKYEVKHRAANAEERKVYDAIAANYTAPQPDGVVVPREPGWYWMADTDGARVVEVFKRPGHEYLAIAADISPGGKRDFLAVEKMPKARWFGPLHRPVMLDAAQEQNNG